MFRTLRHILTPHSHVHPWIKPHIHAKFQLTFSLPAGNLLLYGWRWGGLLGRDDHDLHPSLVLFDVNHAFMHDFMALSLLLINIPWVDGSPSKCVSDLPFGRPAETMSPYKNVSSFPVVVYQSNGSHRPIRAQFLLYWLGGYKCSMKPRPRPIGTLHI